jgi:GMP reductase
MIENTRYFNYHNMFLVPRKCIVNSRKECDTSVRLGDFTFDMPIYPSNMKSVVNEKTCIYFASRNWFYTMHRFGVDNIKFVKNMRDLGLLASISIGINKDSYDTISELAKLELNPEFVTIDIAHAWCDRTTEMIKFIKNKLPKTFVIAGNVACGESAAFLQASGADALRVGIAGGKVCITKNKTGFHVPTPSSIKDAYEHPKVSIPLIADGGTSENGDVAKALACGAHMIMAGSMFSGYDESAGSIIEIEGRKYKEYFGSASEFNKEKAENIEGKKILVEYKGSIDKLMRELKEDLQSSISYAGGKDISAFKDENLKMILV